MGAAFRHTTGASRRRRRTQIYCPPAPRSSRRHSSAAPAVRTIRWSATRTDGSDRPAILSYDKSPTRRSAGRLLSTSPSSRPTSTQTRPFSSPPAHALRSSLLSLSSSCQAPERANQTKSRVIQNPCLSRGIRTAACCLDSESLAAVSWWLLAFSHRNPNVDPTHSRFWIKFLAIPLEEIRHIFRGDSVLIPRFLQPFERGAACFADPRHMLAMRKHRVLH